MAKKYWIYKGEKIPVKKYYPDSKKNAEQLFNELVRKTGQANKRLRAIRNEFGNIGWAGENLKQKTEMSLVSSWTSRGIKVKRSMTPQQMKATLKAIENFLNSKTSSVKGIRQTIKRQQLGLQQTLSNFDIGITTKESQTLYKFFEDKDFNYVTRFISPSDLFVLVQDAKEQNDNLNSWIDRVENYIVLGEDEEVRNALESMYNKYVRS